MPAPVMRPHLDAHHFSRIDDDRSGCRIGYGENPLVRVDSLFPNIIVETVRQFLGDKYNLGLASAFGGLFVSGGQLVQK